MKKLLYLINYEIFKILAAALVIFIIFELIKPRSVLAFVNLNVLLVIWLISGIITVCFKNK